MPIFDEEHDRGPGAARPTDRVAQPRGEHRVAIDGREAALPLRIADCSILGNLFTVPASAAQAAIEGSGLRIAEPLLPGRALLFLLGVQYRDNPWGNYNEAVIAFAVAGHGGARIRDPFALLSLGLPLFIYRMPVDQEFTLHAGRALLGMPKYLARIGIELEGGRAGVRLEQDGGLVFALEAPAGSGLRVPDVRMRAVATRAGRTLAFPWTIGGKGLSFRLGGSKPEIGDRHPLAAELRALGLPQRPFLSFTIRQARLDITVE
jgi:Acetoacetate decarboxylase (ADC)